MHCPRCGYVLEPFERECPRCARGGQEATPRLREAPPVSGYGTPPAPPLQPVSAPPRRSMPVGLLLVVVAAFAGTVYAFVSAGTTLTTLLGHAHRPTGILIQPLGDDFGSGSGGVLGGPPPVDDQQMDRRLHKSLARTGTDLEVSLAWNCLSDFDLELRDPSGEVISAHHRQSTSGGVMDVDANPTLVTTAGEGRFQQGLRPRPEDIVPLPDFLVDMDQKLGLPPDVNPLEGSGTSTRAPARFTRTPIEHIYFPHPPRGTYTVYARCYSWREGSQVPQPFTVQVRSKGITVCETSGTLGPISYVTTGIGPTPIGQFRIQ